MRALILSLIVLAQVPVWGADFYWSAHDGEIFVPFKALFGNYERTYARFEKGQCGLLVDAIEDSNVVRLIFVDNVDKKTKCLSHGVVFGTFACGKNNGSIELSTSKCFNSERDKAIYIGASGDLSVYLPEGRVVFADTLYRLK